MKQRENIAGNNLLLFYTMCLTRAMFVDAEQKLFKL